MENEKFQSVVDLIVESWRLNRFIKNLAERIADPKVQKKSFNQVARFEKHLQSTLDAMNLSVIDFTGEDFEDGLPILPINLGDFNANDVLMVETMMEPTVKVADTAEIIKKGAAVLRRKDG